MLHERSPKDSAMDVIVYERDLLGHCANSVDAKRTRLGQHPFEANKAEYFLTIEGFLLHYRNLLGFFINKGKRNDDFTLDGPERWSEEGRVDKDFCNGLIKRAERVNDKYRLSAKVDCYGKISKFLQHCTVLRYEQQRSWDLSGMFADFSPIVDEFIARFAPEKVGPTKATPIPSQSN